MNFMQRSVLQKYDMQNNDTLMHIFDRMINTGSVQNFTDEEIQMFEDIEQITNGSGRLKMEGQPKCHNMFLLYYWKNKEIPFNDGQTTMHYGQTTDESVCCQIFPGMLKEENNVDFDVTNVSFWVNEPNPWQIIFDGYKKGIKPGKQVSLLLRPDNGKSSFNESSMLCDSQSMSLQESRASHVSLLDLILGASTENWICVVCAS